MKLSLLATTLVLFTLGGCSIASKLGLGSSSSSSSSPGSSTSSPAHSSPTSARGDDEPGGEDKPKMSEADADLYLDTASNMRGGLKLLEELEDGKELYHYDFDATIRWFSTLLAHDRACKERQFPKYRSPHSFDPVETCAKAAGYKAAAAKYLPSLVTKKLANALQDDEARIATITKTGWADDAVLADFADPAAYVARARAPYDKLAATYGLALDAGVFAKVEANAGKVVAQLKKAAKTSRYPARLTRSDAGFMRAATEHFGDGGKVLEVGYASNWTVTMNSLDVPVSQWTIAYVKVARTGEPYCRIYQGTAEKTHEGGGRYGKPFLNNLRKDFQISSCH
jgi:hypothetical protein